MTRRNFGSILSIMSVAMIGNLIGIDGAIRIKTSADREHHIRNRRLFNLAAGRIVLAEWEREHLHKCATCQTMADFLIRSVSRFPDLEFKDLRS